MANTSPRKAPRWARKMMQFQAFLLRHNLLGRLGDELMVITTTGRKSGQKFATPLGFLRDGDTLIALNPHGRSDWFKNVMANPEALLEIRGKTLRVRAERVVDLQERMRLCALYRQQRPGSFKLLFGVPVDASADQLREAMLSREFVRFRVLS